LIVPASSRTSVCTRLAMAGEEHECRVAGLQPCIELGQELVHGPPPQVLAPDHLKTDALQRGRDGAGIADGLVQRRERLVTVIADDQGDTLGGGCGSAGEPDQRNSKQEAKDESIHWRIG